MPFTAEDMGRLKGLEAAMVIIDEHASYFATVTNGKHPDQIRLWDGTTIVYHPSIFCVYPSCWITSAAIYQAVQQMRSNARNASDGSGRVSIMGGMS